MLRIGLTGGIAAGKSVVARRFGELGAVVVDADALARAVLEPGSEGLREVVAAFGREILGPNGGLDRAALGALVFADEQARDRLNGIVHPRVRRHSARLVDEAPRDAILVQDTPLLVETGQAARFHLVVVVDAPDEVRVERMVGQRGMERGDALRRMAAQASRTDRLREADAVLRNEGTVQELLAAADALWHERIVPFADNLLADRTAGIQRSAPSGAGLAGTSGLTRRIVAKLDAALPAGSALPPVPDGDVVPGTATGTATGAGGGSAPDSDDVTRTVVRVPLLLPSELDRASRAVSAAGFPRLTGGKVPAEHEGRAVHRSADPALDVTVLVTGQDDPGT
ncbi:dephospho-CoA kinase [Arthrobacter echini]|uniref:Dephospho-CoA kinase n=1 Tax=Arthrobacter echini TaxID=1529066 RepID=A0A4V3Z5T3_9MICC|nr:dephospho-CoA kinase [Arthrobacter echini]THJ67399.1 dephospho-CoA kinase [Arthrobacter echini]